MSTFQRVIITRCNPVEASQFRLILHRDLRLFFGKFPATATLRHDQFTLWFYFSSFSSSGQSIFSGGWYLLPIVEVTPYAEAPSVQWSPPNSWSFFANHEQCLGSCSASGTEPYYSPLPSVYQVESHCLCMLECQQMLISLNYWNFIVPTIPKVGSFNFICGQSQFCSCLLATIS